MTTKRIASIATSAATDFAIVLHDQANKDADAVAEFLISRGLFDPNSTSRGPGFTVDQLLGIALSLRLRRWELNGIRVHVEAGLPTSEEVLNQVCNQTRARTLKKIVEDNWTLTILTFHESILWWTDQCDLAGDIAIVANEDSNFVDAIVDFLVSINSNRTGV